MGFLENIKARASYIVKKMACSPIFRLNSFYLGNFLIQLYHQKPLIQTNEKNNIYYFSICLAQCRYDGSGIAWQTGENEYPWQRLSCS